MRNWVQANESMGVGAVHIPFRGLPRRRAAGAVGGMALFGTLSTLRAQAPHTATFAVAFDYVDELLRPGSPSYARLQAIGRGESRKIELTYGAFAIEQVYDTKARADGVFESHRKMIDLQVVIEGEELMEVVDLSRAAVRQAYDADKDYALYADSADAAQLKLTPGLAAIFFPPDVHMPTLRLHGDPVLVRKTVVKIPVA